MQELASTPKVCDDLQNSGSSGLDGFEFAADRGRQRVSSEFELKSADRALPASIDRIKAMASDGSVRIDE